MADIPLWTCHCYGRGIHLHRDATSITADFNLFLLCPPSFNVPILLLQVVKTYIQLPICCLFEQPVCQICKKNSLQNISTDELVQRDVSFFDTYLAQTLSVRIILYTLSILLSAQIMIGFTLKLILHNLVSNLSISDIKIKLLVIYK